jgi:Flp pilus assembly protein CpaB
MVATTLTPARALRRPRHIDLRALIGVCVTLTALGGSVAYWAGSNETRGVVIATRDLPAGATLVVSDLAVAYVRVDELVYRAAVPAETLDALVGKELAEPTHAQQVLARGQVGGRSGLTADQTAVTIPARPDSTVNGRLKVGDQVQVLVTVGDRSKEQARTRVVLDRVTVYDVGREQALGGSSTDTERLNRGNITTLTLAVTADEARGLIEARRAGELDVILLPPRVEAPLR